MGENDILWWPSKLLAIQYRQFYPLLRQIGSVGQLVIQKDIMDYSFSVSKSAYKIELKYQKVRIIFFKKD